MVLDVDEYAVLFCSGEEREMVREGFYCGFSYEDVDAALDGVERDGVVCCVGSEDCDSGAGREGVDRGFVGVGVDFVVRWKTIK